MSSKADRSQVEEDLMRRRIAFFVGNERALDGMSPAEIKLAIRGAFADVQTWIASDDATLN
jgi:hypothetical protein